MFIEERILKRLIKQAYKAAGLVLVNTGEDYIIEGSYWAIQVQKEHLPKKIKAAIIELTGELPGILRNDKRKPTRIYANGN